MCGNSSGDSPEMPRWVTEPMRTFWQVLSASCWMIMPTLCTLSFQDILLGSFSSAVYSSISNTVRLLISVSAAQAIHPPSCQTSGRHVLPTWNTCNSLPVFAWYCPG